MPVWAKLEYACVLKNTSLNYTGTAFTAYRIAGNIGGH